MAAFPEQVTTARLRLTRWDTKAHTPALVAINSLPEVVEFLNEGVQYTPEETRRQSERFATQWARHGFGLWAAEVAVPQPTVIGFVGLAHPIWFPELSSEVEVGWRLHPSAWGHGYATEAAGAALTAAVNLPVDRIIAIIDTANTRSLAVATRLGMTVDRVVPHPQRPGSVAIYTLSVAE